MVAEHDARTARGESPLPPRAEPGGQDPAGFLSVVVPAVRHADARLDPGSDRCDRDPHPVHAHLAPQLLRPFRTSHAGAVGDRPLAAPFAVAAAALGSRGLLGARPVPARALVVGAVRMLPCDRRARDRAGVLVQGDPQGPGRRRPLADAGGCSISAPGPRVGDARAAGTGRGAGSRLLHLGADQRGPVHDGRRRDPRSAYLRAPPGRSVSRSYGAPSARSPRASCPG